MAFVNPMTPPQSDFVTVPRAAAPTYVGETWSTEALRLTSLHVNETMQRDTLVDIF